MAGIRGSWQHLVEIARKKPNLKLDDAMEGIENKSNEEIDSYIHLKPWMRKALKQMRTAKLVSQFESTYSSEEPQLARDIELYNIYQYKGLSCETGDKFPITIDDNDLLIDISQTMIKINSSAVQVTEQQKQQLLSQSTFIRKTDLIDYNVNILQPHFEKKYGKDIPVIAVFDEDGERTQSDSTEAKYSVKALMATGVRKY